MYLRTLKTKMFYAIVRHCQLCLHLSFLLSDFNLSAAFDTVDCSLLETLSSPVLKETPSSLGLLPSSMVSPAQPPLMALLPLLTLT